MANDLSWSFYEVWNQSLEDSKPREMKKRDRMWASELGGSYVDRFLKMSGVAPTNPPNARSLRKFEAGNLMEWVVEMVLTRAGLLRENQTWLRHQYPGLLEVTGKLDFFAGGKPDWAEALKIVDELKLPQFFAKASHQIIEHLSKEYPNGLKEVVLEVKSCSGFMWDRYEAHGANKSHKLQTFHYLKSKNISEGHVIYISKDDLRLLELGVFNPSETEDEYRSDIETMTGFINRNEQPPKEMEIVFDDVKFSGNWKVTYSNYLTLLYGYENQFSFENVYKKKVAQWNRTLGRCIRGDKMTKLNLEVIEEIKKSFPNFDQIVSDLKTKGVQIEDAEEETK